MKYFSTSGLARPSFLQISAIVKPSVEDYERKQLFSLMDGASAIQVLTEKQIDDHFQCRSDNLKYDFEVEKKYMQHP
ncbi:hypothetical protein [Sphingobacterium multivorum]|uniref:hypothetical protein n=1 Tax=Sphingobacterium multivorum TaxID=28454 RepID=UPI0036A802CA